MKIYRLIIWSIAMILGITACNEDPDVELTPPQSEGRLSLDISSEDPLFTASEGTGNSSINFTYIGGTVAVDVLTNGSKWDYTATGAEWLEITKDNYFIYIKAKKNSSEKSYSASVVITAEDEGRSLSATIDVTQEAAKSSTEDTPTNNAISLSATEHNFEAHNSLTTTIEVECSNKEWNFDCNCSWLLIKRVDNNIVLIADDNKQNASRSTEVSVFTGEGENVASQTISVTQDGNAFVTLSSQSMSTYTDGGEKSITFEANPELERHIENATGDWFGVVINDSDIVITVSKNSGDSERNGSFDLVVGDENNNASATVTIHQIGADSEALIYEVEIPEPDYTLTAAPVISANAGGSITVNWGDGSEPELFESRRGTHLYKEPGLYIITITGEASSLKFGSDEAPTTELRNIISWGKLGYTSAVDMCLGCINLESIPNDVAGSFANVKSFVGAFSCCTSLKEIPAGLFSHATAAKRFEDCFSHSASISEIPAGLFDKCLVAEDFSYAFYATGTGVVDTNQTLTNFSTVSEQVRYGHLRSLPAALFAKCSKATQFDYVFGATAIENIPGDLFSTCSLADRFTGAFSACVNLKSIPTTFMQGATGALDIKYMFAGCSSIEEIPAGIFKENVNVTNLEYIFYKTGVHTLEPGIFEGLVNVKTIGAVFQGCESLKEVKEGLFDGLTGARSFRYCFADCTSLRTIPEGLLRNMTAAYEFTYMFHNTALESVPTGLFKDSRNYSSADFTYMFSDCPNLKTVPATLFETFTEVTSPGFRNLFDSSGIQTIPAGLFAKNVKVSSGFESLFENCPELTTIEGSIFPETTTVSDISYLFTNCPKLKTIPEDLFKPFGEAKLKFTATFAACSSLSDIPAGLFSANTKAKQFSETFADCTAITNLPEGLLASCGEVTTVKGMFHGCTSLRTIPGDLFSACPAITSFESTFAECSSLVTLPEGLFSAIGTTTSSITFSECFAACSSLTTIPVTLFDTVRRINYIDGCFDECILLEGESPYTIITLDDGTEQKVHLYEREKGDDFPIIPKSSSAHKDCFAKCKKLSDYYDMPTSWR